ncbi:YgaP family membrane protein [Roseateles sp. LYH14W]|uniref:DUF2892 domain-containing protein n=1 Tax=Pelomonas parva TaxID=3299032 RepID=A0ABW7FB12_9BURK
MLQNVGLIDRTARVLLGLGLVTAAWLGAVGGWGWIGLLPLLTGLLGSCPAYLPFGFSSCAMKDAADEQRPPP